MKRILFFGGSGLFAVTALVVTVMLWRTSAFTPAAPTETVSLPAPPSIDLQFAATHLAEAIRIPTITYQSGDPGPGAEQPWLDFHAWLETTYPAVFATTQTELVADYSLLITWQGADPSLPPLILMAHQDVVPVNPGTEDDWNYDPFAGDIADGHVWGRGAMDDKGSLIAIMEAANALVASGFTPTRTIMFAFGHDEEVSGAGAQAMFNLLASRNVDPFMVLDEGYAVLANYPLTGKPAALIGVAEKGYLSLEITATTEGGHSSRPPRESGAVRIARAIVALEENQMPADLSAEPFEDMIRAVSADLPWATRLAFANRWLLEGTIRAQLESDETAAAIVRTTTAPTMMNGSIKDNILPQRASAVVNFRVHPNDTIEDVIAHVEDVTSHIDGLTVAPYGGGIGSAPSPVSSSESAAFRILEAVAREAGGGDVPVAPALMIAATDSRYATAISDDAIYRFAPAIFGDEDLNGFHGTNERLSLENLERMIGGYAQIMMAASEN